MTTQRAHFSLARLFVGLRAFAIAAASIFVLASPASAGLTVTWSKAFAPDTIGPGSVSTLTFTINNNSSIGVRGLEFVDKLPAGLVIATPANVSSDCGGELSAPAGENTISLVDGSVPGNGSCSISVDVTSSSIGTHTNVTGNLSSDAGNSGSASADLSVVEELPGFSKSFSPAKIGFGGRSTLTFTINNKDNEGSRARLTFLDVLPAGMVVASPSNAFTTCIGGNITAVPGTNVISYTPDLSGGGTVAGFESCTVSVDVIGTAIGVLHNISGDLTSSTSVQDFELVTSGGANASLEVVNDPILITKSFTDDPVPPGGVATLEFTITNRNRDDPATNIRFTDDLGALAGMTALDLPANDVCGEGSQITGTSQLSFTGGSLAAGESCTFAVLVNVPGQTPPGLFPNATSIITADSGGQTIEGSPARDSLVVLPVPILTKEFIDDPVTPGDTVTLEFTITNTSLSSDGFDIAFRDELPSEIDGVEVLPEDGFCGEIASVAFIPPSDFDPATLIVSGIDLQPGENCTFQVVLTIAPGASSGSYTNTTSPITALIDDTTITGSPASDDLQIVAGPQLTKSFIDDPVLPGGTATLEFTLAHSPEAPQPATNIRFTDDLGAAMAGMTAIGLPKSDICGAGSTLTGSSLITFSGGSLDPGQSCTFTVEVIVPENAPLGFTTNTTSSVTSDLGETRVTSGPASDDLLVTSLTLTKEFTDDPVIPGGTTTLQFTITNNGSQDATGVVFFDDLDAALPGLTTTSPNQSDICGNGSSLTSNAQNDLLIFQDGFVPANSSCTFSATVLVPANAPDGQYVNAVQNFTVNVGGAQLSLPGASDVLEVNSTLLQITKRFINSPVVPGSAADLEFTITNLDPNRAATAIAFTDTLPAGLTGTAGTQTDICGAGSQIGGTSTLTFAGGSLAAGESCTFSVPLSVPATTPIGFINNITTEITGTIGGQSVRGEPASALLAVDTTPLKFTKSFNGLALPGGTVSLTFVIENQSPTVSFFDLSFTDDLDSVVPGMVAVSLPVSDICGAGSLLAGTSTISLTGGSLAPLESCSIAVTLQVPANTPEGIVTNTTSDLRVAGIPFAAPAVAALNVGNVQDENPPVITAPFKVVATAAPGASSAVVTFSVSAVDDVSGIVPVACSANSGDTFPAGTTCVTCTATDGAGNIATESIKVIVKLDPGELVEVAKLGDAPTGSPQAITGIRGAFLTGDLKVLVDAQIGAGATKARGLFAGSAGGGLNTVGIAGATNPAGTTGVIAGFDRWFISEGGDIAYYARLSGVPNSADRGRWLNGVPQTIEGSVDPLTTGTYGDLPVAGQALTKSGEFFSNARLLSGSGSVTSDNNSVVYSSNTGIYLQENDPAPAAGGGVRHGELRNQIAANDKGEVVVGTDLRGTGINSGVNNAALFAGSRMVSQRGDAITGLSGVEFDRYFNPAINNPGEVAFTATLKNGGVTPDNNHALFTDAGGSLVAIAREGEVALDFDDPTIVYDEFDDIFICDDGAVYFKAIVRGGTPTLTAREDSAIFVWRQGAGLCVIAMEGGSSPGAIGASFINLPTLTAHGAGNAAFTGLLRTGVGGVTRNNNEGVWTVPMGSCAADLVARGGDMIEVDGIMETVKRPNIAGTPDDGTGGRSSALGGGNLVLSLTYQGGQQTGLFIIGLP